MATDCDGADRFHETLLCVLFAFGFRREVFPAIGWNDEGQFSRSLPEDLLFRDLSRETFSYDADGFKKKSEALVPRKRSIAINRGFAFTGRNLRKFMKRLVA
jgi:hypothetical protein